MSSGIDTAPAVEFAALLIGGGMAATSHFTKAGSRVLINTSPEPVTNWTASIVEDIAVIGGLWTALNYPLLFIALLIAFTLLAIWALPRIWRTLKRLFHRIGEWFRGRKESTDQPRPSRQDILKTLYHDATEEPHK